MRPAAANPFANPDAASHYEIWYETTGRRADRLEKALLKQLLTRFPRANSVLEVGCGTGHFTRWFEAQGLAAAGLDRSMSMLVEAIRLGCPPCVRGDALALPFSDDAFDLVALLTTLEFVGDPVGALVEALRVARLGLILGVLNRQSLLGRRMEREGGPIWDVARFFAPSELVRLVQRAAAGSRAEVFWRTALWPVWPGSLPLPWGGFIGIAVQLS
ncbi:MAG: class I SAM-dependent methyltransferase [Anaerolineae bacterium]